MYSFRTIFLIALGSSMLLWVIAWWRTPPLQTWQYQGSSHLIAFGADGQLLITEQQGVARTRSPDPEAYILAISPDGRRLATGGSDGTARVWDAASGQLLHTLLHAPPDAQIGSLDVPTVDVLVFSPDGQLLATADGKRQAVRLWRVSDGQLQYAIPHASASLAFSPDGQELILSGDPVRVFRVRDGHEVRQFAAAGQVALSPDGRLLAVTKEYSDDGLRIFRYQDGALLQTFRGAYGYSYLAAFSPDSRYLATMYVPGGSGSNLGVGAISLTLFATKVPISVWRTSDWGKVQTLAGNPGGANVLAFSPDGQHIASVGDDLRLWPLAPRDPLWFLIGPVSVLAVLVGGVAWWVWSRR